jgi:hypothetical protein
MAKDPSLGQMNGMVVEAGSVESDTWSVVEADQKNMFISSV